MSTYILESKKEFERLEYQSSLPKYDFRKELAGIQFKSNGILLDAGCGSGIVCRYLADTYRQATVFGCDFSQERVHLAQKAAQSLKNVQIECQNLTQLSYSKEKFDSIICRYVLEHLNSPDRNQVIKEFLRVLKPGGIAVGIDFDGPLLNIYPASSLLTKSLQKLQGSTEIDLQIGRKIPSLFHQAGFKSIHWRIETIQCKGEILEQEIQLWPDKLEASKDFLSRLLGGKDSAKKFCREYIAALREPHVVLFYNKFIVTGVKEKISRLRCVK